MKKLKNYGLKISKKKDPNAYVLGGLGSLAKVVLQPNGQWDAFLPERELQYNSFYDTFNCTGYGTNAIFETLLNRLGDKMGDRSDRYLGIRAGTKPPGNDPHKVAQVARDYGVIAESSLPFKDVNTVGEYYSFKGGDSVGCDLEGQDFLRKYEIGHEYVWEGNISRAERMYRIKEALTYSPLGISVTAWIEKDGVFVDGGKPNTHWVMAFGWTDKGIKVFDSYDQTFKIVSWDHNIEICKRYMLTKQATKEEIGIFIKMLQAISSWLTAWSAEQKSEVITSPTVTAQPIVQPVGSKLIEWATAIRDYEGGPGDLNYRLNNPGNIRSVKGPFLKFKTWNEGWKYLLDYLTRAATGKHPAYKPHFTLLQFFAVYAPAADKNNPDAYARWVAKRIGVTINEKIKNLV